MQFLASFIMKGRLQAMLVAASLALVSIPFPPASIVSSAAVALVTLRLGAREGVYVLLCACLAAALLGMVTGVGYQFALMYGMVLWLPVWVISIVLREGRHLAIAIEIAALLGVLGVLGFYLYEPKAALVWQDILTTITQPVLQGHPDLSPDDARLSIQALSHLMTGLLATGSVYGLLFGLFLARWWQAVLYNPGGFRAEFLELKGHKQMALATLVMIVVAGLTSGLLAEIVWNLILVVSVLYTFVGTAVLHAAFASMKNSRFMVPFLYLTLILIPHMLVFVALMGVADPWMNLRKKISNQTTV
ncbi:MAG: DUF2232 domain-containing protein [Methylomonas sp.]|nr:DUF2232 domain-containing protein [Methylomonas sp.]PPD20374.1 MAG: hypothetical protein CTY23_08850 [Methylomonas sp.]PPD25413.1 MAG: hypothetical protein CTY22_08835 [Methylomonas sp.]PPD35970.1 MAG: hypothetical protein CTY21_08835 [Methylomonas sp.]PPD37741.1 MAG: hypothetical protein CTY17_10550 [Methylomonas sp.]